MNIHEFQAKEVFSRYGIPVPKGIVASTPKEAEARIAAGNHRPAHYKPVEALGTGMAQSEKSANAIWDKPRGHGT